MSLLPLAVGRAVFVKLAMGMVLLAFASIASAVDRDLIIILDNSRNMERVGTADVVPSVLGRFLDGLDGNARVALIRAVETSSVAFPLDRPMGEYRVGISKALTSWADRGKFSNIPKALEQAFDEFARNGREQAEKSILLIVAALSDPHALADIQFRLHALGYPVGPIDGLIGPKTRGALRDFHRDQRPPGNGLLNRELLAHIDTVYGERLGGELSAQADRRGVRIVTVVLGGVSPLGRGLAEQTSGEYIRVSYMEEWPRVVERLTEAFAGLAEISSPSSPTAPLPSADATSPKDEEALTQTPSKALPSEEAPETVQSTVWLWVGFTLFILLLLSLDLGVFHRRSHVIQVKEALSWSAVWVGLALLFNVFIYFAYEYHWLGLDAAEDEPDGRTAAVLFFTGYGLEKSLSVDNLFVIAMIFAVPPQYQHRVLFWGILGALVMRAVMIVVGAELIQRYHWILYLFGVFLIITAARMLLAKHDYDPSNNPIVRLARRLFPIRETYAGPHFTVRVDGKLMLTPLMLALILVESADLMFALDSIPAIFAITEDPFIVFSSNVFAILGLRSLYFALAGIMDKFHYLKLSLALLLALVGVKMLLKDMLHTVPNITYYTLGVIALILTSGVVASLIRAHRRNKNGGPAPADRDKVPLESHPMPARLYS